jgi:hypothetical protein
LVQDNELQHACPALQLAPWAWQPVGATHAPFAQLRLMQQVSPWAQLWPWAWQVVIGAWQVPPLHESPVQHAVAPHGCPAFRQEVVVTHMPLSQ